MHSTTPAAPAANITEADVRAFIVAQRVALNLPARASVHCYTSPVATDGWWIINFESYHGYGLTLAEAHAAFLREYKTPEERKDELRRRAAELLAQADAIDGRAAA